MDNHKRLHAAVERRIRIERKVTRAVIRYLRGKGWSLYSVNNGEETIKVMTEKEAMEHIFSVDTARLYLRKGDDRGNILFVMGNDGPDVICDWGWKTGGFFNVDMEGFKNPCEDE